MPITYRIPQGALKRRVALLNVIAAECLERLSGPAPDICLSSRDILGPLVFAYMYWHCVHTGQ